MNTNDNFKQEARCLYDANESLEDFNAPQWVTDNWSFSFFSYQETKNQEIGFYRHDDTHGHSHSIAIKHITNTSNIDAHTFTIRHKFGAFIFTRTGGWFRLYSYID